jgi:hypothetical protein
MVDVVNYNDRDIEVIAKGPLTLLSTNSKENSFVTVNYLGLPKPGIYQVYLMGPDRNSIAQGSEDVRIKADTYFTDTPTVFKGKNDVRSSVNWSELEDKLSVIISKKELDDIVRTFEEFQKTDNFKEIKN